MRVLVTGASGFVGCHTAAALVRGGHEVRALVRNPARLTASLGPLGVADSPSVSAVTGDVTDPVSVGRAIGGCDAVVHAAAVFTLDRRRDADVHATNAGGARLVLTSAVDAGLDPVVHVSSISALFPPDGPVLTTQTSVKRPTTTYARSKADAELLARDLQEGGAPVTIVYPGGVWGPDDPTLGEQVQVVLQALRMGVRPVTEGGFPLVDVRDVAAVHRAAMEQGRGPRRYMAGGRLLPTDELFGIIAGLTGRRLLRVPVPGAALRAAGRAGDLVSRLVPLPVPLTYEAMATLTGAVPTDDTATVADLGVTFRPPEETIADTLRWLHATGQLPAGVVGRLAGPEP